MSGAEGARTPDLLNAIQENVIIRQFRKLLKTNLKAYGCRIYLNYSKCHQSHERHDLIPKLARISIIVFILKLIK